MGLSLRFEDTLITGFTLVEEIHVATGIFLAAVLANVAVCMASVGAASTASKQSLTGSQGKTVANTLLVDWAEELATFAPVLRPGWLACELGGPIEGNPSIICCKFVGIALISPRIFAIA